MFGGAAALLAVGRPPRSARRAPRTVLPAGRGVVRQRVGRAPGAALRRCRPGHQALLALHPDAFLPLFLWLFVQQFPAAAPRRSRPSRRERWSSAWRWPPASCCSWPAPRTAARAGATGLGRAGHVVRRRPVRAGHSRRCRSVCGRPRVPTSASGAATASSSPASPSASCRSRPRCSPRRPRRPMPAFINVPPRRLLVGLVLYPLLLSIPADHRLRGGRAPGDGREGAGPAGGAVCAGPLHDRRAGRGAGGAARGRARPQPRPDDRRAVHDPSALSTSVPLGGAAARARRPPVAAGADRPHVLPRGRRHPHAPRARWPRRRPRRAATGSTPCADLQRADSEHAAPGPGRRPRGRLGGRTTVIAAPAGCGRCRSRAGSPPRSRRGRIRWCRAGPAGTDGCSGCRSTTSSGSPTATCTCWCRCAPGPDSGRRDGARREAERPAVLARRPRAAGARWRPRWR